MDKTAERTTLVYLLGEVLSPIKDLTKQSNPPDSADYRVAAANLRVDFTPWANEANRFVNFGKVRFDQEYSDIVQPLSRLIRKLDTLARSLGEEPSKQQEKLGAVLEEVRNETLNAINSVPIKFEPHLSEAGTPFSTYLKIFDAINTAMRRVHYFDRYLNSDFFPLYLRNLKRSLEIRLITTKGKQGYGITNVIAVANLAAQEFADFQLIECDYKIFHERNLRIDDKIMFIGTGVGDAGSIPTSFNPTISDAKGHKILDDIMGKGKRII